MVDGKPVTTLHSPSPKSIKFSRLDGVTSDGRKRITRFDPHVWKRIDYVESNLDSSLQENERG